MSVIISSKEEVQKYYESEALSQSKLKKLLGDPSNFNAVEDSSAAHFVIGSAVDCILTEEKGEFERSYYVLNSDNIPSEAISEIIKNVFNRLIEDYEEFLQVVSEETTEITSFKEFCGTLASQRDYLLAYASSWQPRWGDDAKINNLLKDGENYFKGLIESFGRTVLSLEQKRKIDDIVKNLKESPRTKPYFDRKEQDSLVCVDFIYQLPVYFTYRGVECKALLDQVAIVIENARVVSVYPIDLKTMSGSTLNFLDNVKKFRYDIQAAWYSLALCHYLLDNYAVLGEELEKIIQPFTFVVESSTSPGKPLVYTLDKSFLYIGRHGMDALKVSMQGEEHTIRKAVLGYESLVDKYLYHIENGFDYPKEIQDYGLTPVKLDWNGVVTKS